MYNLESPTFQASVLPCTTQDQAQARKLQNKMAQNPCSPSAIEQLADAPKSQSQSFVTVGTRYLRLKARLQEKKRRSEALKIAQEKADLACESLRKTLETVDESSWVLIDEDEAEYDIINYDDAGTSRSALERARGA